ncbi:MAG: DUF1638 domain-containing protein [Syntrophobacteraceae bacterium]|nr:DUF1638 domain-containing protein [Syntrophobacteraceae bacterium]
MAVIGVVTCEVLELEFAHLLSRDPDVSVITVVEDSSSAAFIEALESTGQTMPRRIPLLRGYTSSASDGLEVLVRVLELALHNRKWILQEGLTKATREMARYVDGIFLGYGLCGNALQNIHELLADVSVPVMIPMDTDHPVDDCVGLIIGGRDCYYEEQCREAGTFFMIPGWTRHWRRILEKEYGDFDEKMAKRVFGAYRRSLLIPTPVLSEERMRENTEEFNRLFGFRVEVRPGVLGILQESWEKAKRTIEERT